MSCDLAHGYDAAEAADGATHLAYRRFSHAAGGGEPGTVNAWHAGWEKNPEERVGQCQLLRCIFGSPFRPVAADAAWLAWHGGAIVKLAQVVYEERELPSGHLDTARLAILADLLEEAGATDPQLLGHLRSPGPARGQSAEKRVRQVRRFRHRIRLLRGGPVTIRDSRRLP
jgi:hypothetical protein